MKFIASKNSKEAWIEYNKVNESINSNIYLNEIIEELKNYSEKYPIYTESTFSSLSILELKDSLFKYKRIIITGAIAECCVLSTCFHAFDLGIKIIYISDAVAGIDETEKSYPMHAYIMTTQEYIKSINI